MALALLLPAIPVTRAASVPEINAQIQELQMRVISLLQQLIAILQQRAVVVEDVPVIEETVSAVVSIPISDTFVFDIYINDIKGNTIKLPAAPYTKADYLINYKVSNGSGNPISCNTTGFIEGNQGVTVSFYSKFLEKKVYEATISCSDNITGISSSKTITVDTR